MNKMSIRGILVGTGIAVAALFASVSTSYGQYESLNPRNWFPLEAGNAWSYHLDLFDRWIVVSTIDTTAFDLVWRKFQVVQCGGPLCPRDDYWQALTDDDYPLRTSDFSEVDTLIRTRPTSFLRSSAAVDTTLAVACSGDISEPAVVETREVPVGNPADSTHLWRSVGSGNIFCDNGHFVYKIGYWGSQQLQLDGAIVNDLEWGSVRGLREILSAELPAQHSDGLHMGVYPNPARRFSAVEVRVDQPGIYEITIVSPLGETLQRERHFFTGGGPTVVSLSFTEVAPGLYFVRLTDGIKTHFKPIVLTR